MIEQAVYPAIIAFILELILCPLFIPLLSKLKFGQYIRAEGPKEHLKKAGTPTMGGIVILLSLTIASLFFMKGNQEFWPVLLITWGFGLIGLLDDFIKVVMKHNLGLKAWQKFSLQLIVAGLFALYLYRSGFSTRVEIPFTGGKAVDLKVWFYPFVIFMMVGFVNGVNMTDGLDGLASGVTVLVATFFAVVSWGKGSGLLPIASAAAGSLLGFLLFNTYPAKVFMGDTGSLALGGFVTALAFMLEIPLFLVIVGFIYVAEALSVILQVGYFKLTKGKRIFKMAPLHHHFELCGWSETKVVAVFSIITAMLCLVGLLLV
ncbi:MAG: phospho-N-acetylmuramoyl-pentapeptide-transferase [Clostridia bacterium]|jgi:phospho-N-acetylmuramoyl-pentapeptide-transferase|uniref:Phospho-N-acetylmuramoyl-pentapeptide-transferase n=1 Tax=Bianquea renquensis TaxID=2763661 RepID=A0A926DRD7_9FIRM|nr:phospho-N-acetylmuramoyl-pentapeptide-transferase [Bianquea renquensis]MBC8543818.1 phospho-N-acetylmuramoyl-pentapeptide-transferase [Bianquea renquensis]